MVWSFTAPVINKEQEREEIEALSEEERQNLRNQLFGEFVVPEEKEHDMNQAPVLMQEALEAIPNRDKQDYLEAMERVPELVEHESKAIWFMRVEKYNAWAAARRLVEYWKLRKTLFGETRAFLPMTLEGAMADDMDYIQLGILQLLPRDEHERPVLFGDRIRCLESIAPRDALLRGWFYILQLICQDDTAQKKGYVIVLNAKGYNFYRHFDRLFAKRGTTITYCMPAHACALHYCTGPGKSVVTVIMPTLKHIFGKHLRMHLVLHAGSDRENLATCELYGLKRENLSYIIGGGYSQRDYERWLEARRLSEGRTSGN